MAAGFITMRSSSPPMSFSAMMGGNGAVVDGGYGGWSVVNRPKKVGMTQWDGREPFSMQIELIIDGWRSGEPVEIRCTTLERMALPPVPGAQPPTLRISGNLPHTDLTWALNGIEWGASLRDPKTGLRLRQIATIKLLQFVDEDRVKIQPAAEKARGKNLKPGKESAKIRTVVVSKGDTLPSIAARVYGDHSRWREIAELNNIRDGRNIKVGAKLRLP